jgi:hypothetical protein
MTAQTRAGPRGGAAGSSEITKFSGFGSHKLPQAENQIASRNPRLRHLAARIHELGERPLYELFLELERGTDLHNTLERYARLSPLAEFIAARRNRGRPLTALSAIRVGERTRRDLGDIAARIRDEHDACAHAMKRGFEHAVAAGRLLIEAKAQVAHGQWRQWLGDNVPASERTCQTYMQVARAFVALGGDEANAQRVAADAVLSAKAKPKQRAGREVAEASWAAP